MGEAGREDRATSSLEQQIIERVRRELASRGRDELPAAASDAAREVILDAGLSPEESAALAAHALRQDLDPVSLLLGLRIERALRAGLAAAEAADEPAHRTEVVVVRAPGSGSKAERERELALALQRLSKRLAEHTGESDGHLLLLAARQVYDKVRRMLPIQGTASMPTLVYHEEESLSTGFTGTASIEITRTDVALPAFEKEVSERAEQIRRESVTLETGAAPASPAEGTVPSAAPEVPAAPVAAIGSSEPEDPLIGKLFHNKYRIVRRIGRGGFGSVYEGTDERGAGNRVAIKVLSGAAAESAITQQSFRDEARRVTRLSHPNVVDWKVFDETEEGIPYFVMELVEGEEFGDTLKRERRIEPRRAARLLLQVLDALRAAHHLSERESILHLDLKPNNLFLVPARHGREEQMKVIDFGIGQFIGDEQAPHEAAPIPPSTQGDDVGPSTLTFAPPPGSGSAGSSTTSSRIQRSLGCTPEYASPEQCAHVLHEEEILPLDGRSDLYSLGCVAFKMLTGTVPFVPKENRLDVLRMHREEPPPALASTGVKVPRDLARFVERSLRKDRDERWRDTQEAYEFLRDIVHPPVWKTVAKVTVPLLLVAGAVGGWLWSQRDLGVPLAGLVDDAGADLSATALYLGPERTAVTLELGAVEGAAPPAGEGTWKLVDAASGEELEGFEVDWADGEAIGLRASGSGASGRSSWSAELRLEPSLLRSKGFTLVWLGADSWSLDEVAVGGRAVEGYEAIAVDPDGAALDVWIARDGREDLAGVRARVGAAEPLELPRGQSISDRVRYRLDLSDAGLAPGEQTVELELLDRASRREVRSLALDAVTGALTFDRALLANARSDGGAPAELHRAAGRFVVSPRSDAALVVELPRAADLAWSVHVEGAGSSELEGESTGLSLHEIALDGLAELRQGRPYAGTVRLDAREDAYVRRTAGSARGRAELELRFVFEPSEPRFAARWVGAETAMALDPGAAGAHYTNVAAGVLHVVREEPVPMRVEVAWWPEGQPDAVQAIPVEDLRNVQASEARVPLELPADGNYALRVRSWRYESSAIADDEGPEVEQAFELVLDRHAPRLVMTGLASGARIAPETPAPARLTIGFEDVGAGEPAGVAVEVLLRRVQPPGGPVLPFSLTDVDVPGGDVVELEDPWAGLAADADGRYECVVSGRDRAGNVLAGPRVAFDVALHGPEFEPLEPTGVGDWHPEPTSGRWRVRLRARDPNGIGAIECELVTAPEATEGVEVQLEAEAGSTPSEQVLAGALVLPHELSNERVWLRLRARDALGTEGIWTSPAYRLPPIAPARPERIVARLTEGAPGAMRLVTGNEGFSYLFGGRGDRIENNDFLRAGLAPFNSQPRRSRSRSWQIEYGAGQIGDFYLDEREVSTAEYLEFVRAAGGWPNEAHWPEGSRPDEARRAALEAMMLEREPELPATGLTWDEACAYARWTGRRLATWVEWEYAVRGGADYRPFASFDPASPSSQPTGAGLAACGASTDWTPDRAFADLCSNAAEWTATGFGVDDGARYPHLWASAHRDALLQPDPGEAASFWVVGGPLPRGRADFAVADFLPRDQDGPGLGFRCAVSLDTVREGLGRPTTDGSPWYEELAP